MEPAATMVRTLSEQLSRLEEGTSRPGDWVRLEAAVRRAAFEIRKHVTEMCPSLVDCDALGELFEELRYIKLSAEIHLFELQTERIPSPA